MYIDAFCPTVRDGNHGCSSRGPGEQATIGADNGEERLCRTPLEATHPLHMLQYTQERQATALPNIDGMRVVVYTQTHTRKHGREWAVVNPRALPATVPFLVAMKASFALQRTLATPTFGLALSGLGSTCCTSNGISASTSAHW